MNVPEIRREWVAAEDSRTRKSHGPEGADGQVRDQGVAFDVGGAKLMFPGDPAGPAAQTVMCRCTAVPVIE